MGKLSFMFKKVSIIIPSFNEEQFIGRCLQSILEIDRHNMELELIVIDNGSTDKTTEIAKEYGALVSIKPGVKVATLRNYGVTLSNGDLLAFVDADCTVFKDWLNQAIQCMNRESAGAVGSFHIIPKDANWIGKTAALIQKKKTGVDINYIPSGNMIVKRSAFCDVGGFDESLETSEDADLCYKLKLKGYRLFIDPMICSIHWGVPRNIKELFIREMWHGKTMFTVFFRDLKGVRNLRLVLFICTNGALLLSMILGTLVLFNFGSWSLLIISSITYLSLNLIVTFYDWNKIRKRFFWLFSYTIIYGLARSASIARCVYSMLSATFKLLI